MAEEMIVLFENDKIRAEKILSFGASTPKGDWYDSDWDEWVSVVAGSAVLEFEEFEESKLALKAGESFYIKAHIKHRVEYTSQDCEWLCVYIKL